MLQVFAPGRLCLVGEHCDYAKGKCIALPTPQRVNMSGVKKAGDLIKFISSFNGQIETLEISSQAKSEQLSENPLRYCGAIIRVMLQKGYKIQGAQINITTDLPAKIGLSSSAALLVATVKIFNKIYNLKLAKEQIAEIAYLAEHDVLGVGCGRMDQLASVYNAFILLDFSNGKMPKVKKLPKPVIPLDLLIGIPTKTNRNTGQILKDCNRAYFNPNNRVDFAFQNALDDLFPNQVVEPMKESLKAGDLFQIGSLMRLAQKFYDQYFVPLSKHLNAVSLKQCLAVAKNNGSLGEKWSGAGGAGSFVCLTKSADSRETLKKALFKETDLGLEFIDITI